MKGKKKLAELTRKGPPKRAQESINAKIHRHQGTWQV
jgi:hypothetical protein